MPLLAKRTLTPLEIAARRRNAQKSTGPRTPAGKFRSSLNALKRGLCPLTREQLIEFWREDVRDYRRLHRDLLNLLLPQDVGEARHVADLAEAWWEKLHALRVPRWSGLRAARLQTAEEGLDAELQTFVQTLRRRSRQWWHNLERQLGGTFSSPGELRKLIESRLPAPGAKRSKATLLDYLAGRNWPVSGPLIYSPSDDAGTALKTKDLHKMSPRNEAAEPIVR